MHMEVEALFGRFVWRGINIYDVTIHPSRGSRINPTGLNNRAVPLHWPVSFLAIGKHSLHVR